jgi:hypothetical protein
MTEKKKKNNIINSRERKGFFGLPSFTGPVIQPGCPAYPGGGGGFYGTKGGGLRFMPPRRGGVSAGKCGGYGVGRKSLTAYQARTGLRRGGASGLWPGVGRLSAVNATATGFGSKGIAQGRRLSLTKPWGWLRIT